MNRIYPFNESQILNDTIFVNYGGSFGDTTDLQREAAYFIAEDWVSNYINTPIAFAVITGSYFFPQYGTVVQLPWGYLQNIYEIRFKDTKGDTYYTIEGTNNTYAAIRNRERSVIDILTLYGNCQGCGRSYVPYEYEIVYSAGITPEMSNNPKTLLALVETAKLVLNEIQGWGNEASLVGVTEFANQDYREKRGRLHDTVFGSSPKAMLISKLLSGVRRLLKVGL